MYSPGDHPRPFFYDPTELYHEPVTMWDHYGLLAGLHGEVKDICRQNYQKMALFMYEEDVNTNVGDFSLEVAIFPIIRKITEGCPLILEDPKKLWDYICQRISDNLDHYKNVHEKSGGRIDIEAYACRDISEEIIDILKSDPCDTTTQ